MPNAPASTQPLVPPQRASSTDLPCRTSSATTMSALKTDGWPQPLRMTSHAFFRKRSGFFLRQLDVRRGLQQAHLVDHLEDQVRDVVDAVAAVSLQAAVADVGEVGVGAALGRRHADLGRRRLVVELHPEALEQFLRPFARQRAGLDLALVVRIEVLVEAARAERVPGVQLGDDAEVHEPVGLQRLPERARAGARARARSWRQSARARPCAPGSSRRPRGAAASSACRRAKRMTASAAIAHALQLLPLVVRLQVVQVVERRQLAVDVGLQPRQPLLGRSSRRPPCGRARAAP